MKKAIGLVIIFVFLHTLAIAADKRYEIPPGDSPQRGPLDAPVTIIEFLDFQ